MTSSTYIIVKTEAVYNTLLTLKQLLKRLEAVQMVFVIIGASIGALGLMILFVGCLATGATRHKVYRAWGARVGGRISCAVVSYRFICRIYILIKIKIYFVICYLISR